MRTTAPPRPRGQIDRAAVEGAPHDDPGQTTHGGELADVVERADAARGEYGDAGGLGHRAGAPEVGAGLGAVARDVGVDDPGRARRRRVAGQRDGVEVEHSRPPVHRHAPVGGVDADDDVIAEALADDAEEGGIERGPRPHDGPPGARLQHRLHVRDLAQAAAHLHRDRRRPGSSRAPARSGPDGPRRLRRDPPRAAGARPRPASRRAIATGSSENTVSASARPCSSRTQRPALRSTAGTISNIGSALSGGRGRAPRSSRAGGYPSAGSSPGGTGSRRARRARPRPGT